MEEKAPKIWGIGPNGGYSPYAPSFEEAPDLHVGILLLLAQGYTHTEIAEMTGSIERTVRQVHRHPPYRDWLAARAREVADKQLRFYTLLGDAQGESAEILLSLVRDGSAKPGERLAALKYYGELMGLTHRNGQRVKRRGDEVEEAPEDRAESSKFLDKAKMARLME